MLENLYTSLIVGFSVFCGVFLAFIAPEELKPGKKYLFFLRTVLYIFIVAILVLSFYTSNFIVILFCLVSLLDVFLNKFSEIVRFGFLGFFFYFGAQLGTLFVLVYSIIFLYGLPAGSLIVEKEHGQKWYFLLLKASVPYLVFLITANYASVLF